MEATSPFGSVWRKWDVHIHSPESVLNNQFAGATRDEQWEAYLQAIEALPDVAALGITDYWSTQGYERLTNERRKGRAANVPFVFPNVEVRILPVTGEGTPINVHLLVNPGIAADIEELLLARLTFSYGEETYNATRSSMIRLGRAIERNPLLPEEAAFRAGALQFKTTVSDVREVLRTSRTVRENILIAVPNRSGDGNSGLQEGALQATREEIYRFSNSILSSNANDRRYFLGQGVDAPDEVVRKYGGLKPCIHGSDAHELGRIARPDHDRHTWIKSDATFEGLRQICYEPEHRVQIQRERPLEPFHRVERLTISTPVGSELQSDGYMDRFCFSGDYEVPFSPGLTCIIGGRGSGKSTLIHLLKEALVGKSDFFRRNSVLVNGKTLELSSRLTVVASGSPADVEFLTQNEIEQFALDPSRLTVAIYNRLKKLDAEGMLARAEEALAAELVKVDELAELKRREKELTQRRDTIAQDLQSNENLVASLQDPEYTKLASTSQHAAAQLSEVRDDREHLNQLIAALELTLQSVAQVNATAESPFALKRNQLLVRVAEAIAKARGNEDLSKPSDEESRLQVIVDQADEALTNYLEERNISTENIRDISRASASISELRSRLQEVEADLRTERKKQAAIVIDETSREKYEEILGARIEPVNQRLMTMGGEVARIGLRYSFDDDAARQALQEHLLTSLNVLEGAGRAVRGDHLEGLLEGVDLLQTPNRVDLVDAVRRRGAGTKTGQLLLDLFENEFEYERFALRAKAARLDAIRNRRLAVLYDGKPLQNASFGQRCSAALILLLLLGNTPIVIDEPEAHLDSALIADLLVGLLKMIRPHRQVIFATHNANFVVNGGAELIHALSSGPDAPTKIISTTLENLEHRPLILALEGGKKAFQQREERYGMRAVD